MQIQSLLSELMKERSRKEIEGSLKKDKLEDFKYPLKIVIAVENDIITVKTNYPLKIQLPKPK